MDAIVPISLASTYKWVCGGLVVLLSVVVYAHLSADPSRDPLALRRALASGLRTVFSLLLPVVLLAAVPPDERHNPALAWPLAWGFAVWLLDACLLHFGVSNADGKPASLRIDPVSLTSLSFGLCGLLGARPDGKFTSLFLLAIVGCLVLVLPSHNLHPDSIGAQIFESVQKAALLWCFGLFIAGVALQRAAPPVAAKA